MAETTQYRVIDIYTLNLHNYTETKYHPHFFKALKSIAKIF